MVAIAADVILLGLLQGILRRDDEVDYTEVVLTAILLAILNLAIAYLVAPIIGLLALPLMALVDTAVIYWRCVLTWPKAFICAGVLLAVKFALAIFWSA
jgi:hypothetical protein